MSETKNNAELTKSLVDNLRTSHAHATLEKALRGLPEDDRGLVHKGLPYSIWQLVEHLRITQWDMVMFSIDSSHVSPSWPEGYWPARPAPASDKIWKESLKRIEEDRDTFIRHLEKPDADLFTPFRHGDGQTLLQEALQIIDHNAYHVAEIIVLRRLLGNWKG